MRPVLAQVRPAGHIRPTSSYSGVPRRAGILHPEGSPAEITSNRGWSTYRRPRLSRERRIAFSIYRLAWSWNPRNGWTIIGFYSEIITVLQRYWWTHSCSLQVNLCTILMIFFRLKRTKDTEKSSKLLQKYQNFNIYTSIKTPWNSLYVLHIFNSKCSTELFDVIVDVI